MVKDFIVYTLIRVATAPLALLPYKVLHRFGKALGAAAYYLVPKFRKRTLSNLALASTLNLPPDAIVATAKQSMQNLMITCLEYAKLAKEKNIHSLAACENPEEAAVLMEQGKPVIFFCAHQANWEILFLEGTARMPGVAIGRPIKNTYLYNWVLRMREKNGGKIIAPKNAIREGMKGLKRGAFLGIVGDQGMPDSGFYSPFFGRNAWTSPIPAMLAYRTNHPVIVATTRRENGRYIIHYSPVIWPNQEKPMEEEIPRIMEQCLAYLEESIRARPDQWLWQHNRWKQQTLGKIRRPYRQDALCILFPEDREKCSEIASTVTKFRELYPTEVLALYIPKSYTAPIRQANVEIHYYSSENDLLVRDYRYKLLFDFLGSKRVRRHFLSLSVSTVLDIADLRRLSAAKDGEALCDFLPRALCRDSDAC